ncbi:MAG TPA: hypothetical protein VIX58_09270, partial [Anaerolineae bacterium]
MPNLFLSREKGKSRQPGLRVRLSRILVRAVLAAIVLWAGLSIPLPFTPARYFLTVQIPVVTFLFVAYL